MPALLLDTPNPCLKMGNPFQGKEIPYFSPQCQLPQLPMLKQPASTDHSQFRLSSFLRHIWAELHVHGAVRDHSKIVRGHHGRRLGLRGGKWLVPGGGEEACVTDQGLMPPPLPPGKYWAPLSIHTSTLTFPQSS